MFTFRKKQKVDTTTVRPNLSDAQTAYTNFKNDLLRYDIATVMCYKNRNQNKTERKKVESSLFSKHKCAEYADELGVYDRFIYDDTCKSDDRVYKKYTKGLTKKVRNIRKDQPNCKAEDIFNRITGRSFVLRFKF